MRLIKIGLAQVNTTVGAVDSNTSKALALAQQMAEDQVTLGVFQEQIIGGYPPEDLVQWPGFVDQQWNALQHFAAKTAAFPTLFVVGVTIAHQSLRYNCAAVVAGGTIWGLVPKQKLPTYSIFYEGRTFAAGYPNQQDIHYGVPLGDYLFQSDFGLLAVEVCEDLWSAEGPLRRRAYSGAELAVNLSASPFRIGIQQTRRELIATRAADHQCTLVYSNAVGGNDGLIFDGGGLVNQNGSEIFAAARFREGYESVVIDLDRTVRLRSENTTWRLDRQTYVQNYSPVPVVAVSPDQFSTRRESLRYRLPAGGNFFLPQNSSIRSPREEWCEEILEALSLGLGDYFEKAGAFKKLGIALSGGRDSVLTLLIAHRYACRVRPEEPGELIQAFYMPSRFSSIGTQTAAETICRELGVRLDTLSIDDAFDRERAAVQEMLHPGESITAITEQNIQVRIRAQRMWNWSNSVGGLFLQTGNMSEKAVGYTTVGGDLMGALAVIANLPKTVVLHLLAYLEEKHLYQGLRCVSATPAGPELAPLQWGEEELMPFPVLDACFYLFVEEKLGPDEVLWVLGDMFPDLDPIQSRTHVSKFVGLFLQSIYKWVQSPLSLHLGHLDLERERSLQLPVVSRSEWLK